MSDEDLQASQSLPEGDNTSDENSAAQPDAISSDTGTEKDPDQPQENAPKEQDGEGEKPETEAEKADRAQKRINQITRQRWEETRRAESEARARGEAERRALQAEQQLAALRRGETVAETYEDPAVTVEARAAQIADARLAEQKFVGDCNRAYESGVKTFPDFQESVENLQAMGVMQNRQLVEILLDAAGDDASKVLYQLGKDTLEADRILSLPSHRMAAEIAKLSLKEVTRPKPPLSKAPDPIKPISGNAVVTPDDGKLSDDEWWRRYNSR